MQQINHKSSYKLRSWGFRFRVRMRPVILPLALTFLAVNLFFSIFIVGKKVNPEQSHITHKLDQITQEVQPEIQNWLNSTNDSLNIQNIWINDTLNSWTKQGVSLLLFHDTTMVYWSNYRLPAKFDSLRITTTGTIRKIDETQVITQYYSKNNHYAILIINLYDSQTKRYNESIFPEQRISLLPLKDSLLARTVNAETISAGYNQFYLEAKPRENMPWWGELCGWGAIIFLSLYIKNVTLQRTNRNNALRNAGILMLCFILFRIILHHIGMPNGNGTLFEKIFNHHNVIVQSLGDLILSYSMTLIYVAYLFQIRAKLRWHFYRFSIPQRGVTIILLYASIAIIMSVFHYVLIMSIHEPNINIQIYDIFELTYNSAAFYILAVLFFSILLLISSLLFSIISNKYLWMRICLLSGFIILLLLPFESQINNTGYIIVFFVVIGTACDYLRLRYKHYSSFAISLIIFSIYTSTLTTLETRTAQINNQILYARILATSQQDRDIIRQENANINDRTVNIRFKDLTYARVTDKKIIFKHDNNINYQDLSAGYVSGRDTTLYRDNYSHFIYNYYEQDGDNNILIISRHDTTSLNIISLYIYIYLILFILCGLVLNTAGYNFNIHRLGTRMTFKIQAIVISIVIITMISVTMVIAYHTINDFRSNKRQFIHNNIQRLQISLERFLEHDTLDYASVNMWLNYETNDAEYGIAIFATDGTLIDCSDENTIPTRMNSNAYRYLHYMKHPFFITDINLSASAAAYSPIIKKGEIIGYINLQDLSFNLSDRRLQYELIADIINLFLIIFCIALLLSYTLYRILSKPFNELREAMRNVSKMQKIDAVNSSRKISDEVGLLVEQYNIMIDDLMESSRQLSRSEREGAWREIAQQIAHEIKNPLTPMRLKIQMLQRAMKEEECEELRPKVESTMNILLGQIDLLTKITSEFSDFTIISECKPTRINLIPLIYHVSRLYSDFNHINIHLYFNRNNQITEDCTWSQTKSCKDAPIHTDTDTSPIWINADPDQLLRAFVNICQNAVQATTGRENSWLKIELRLTYNSVLISFKDNGPGVQEDLYDKIFMPKFTTKSNGNGLGLPISQKTVEAIGGHISLESTIDVETSFIVSLPLCE